MLRTLLTISVVTSLTAPIFLAPYSKVEESFHTQAVHDLLYFSINYADVLPLFLSHSPLRCDDVTTNIASISTATAKTACEILGMDHLSFPGVVPRSFLPPVVISTVLKVTLPAIPAPQDVFPRSHYTLHTRLPAAPSPPSSSSPNAANVLPSLPSVPCPAPVPRSPPSRPLPPNQGCYKLLPIDYCCAASS